jgi:hypothetical protein
MSMNDSDINDARSPRIWTPMEAALDSHGRDGERGGRGISERQGR